MAVDVDEVECAVFVVLIYPLKVDYFFFFFFLRLSTDHYYLMPLCHIVFYKS